MSSTQDHSSLVAGLLELPLFAKLSKRHQKSLLEFAEIREFPPGTDFVRQGEYTRDFFVVLSGIVTAYRTEKTGTTDVLDQLGPGMWFGELSAISNQPSLARLKADTACVLAVLDAGLFKELRQFSKDFKAQVDGRYRETSLTQHLRVLPLLAGLSQEQLRVLRPIARFEHHEKDTVIAREGESAGEIILVRAGGMSRTRTDASGKEHVVGYLMANSSFGEHAYLGEGEFWQGTYTTLMPTDTLVLPIEAIQQQFSSDPLALETLRKTARLIVAEDTGLTTGLYDADESRAGLDEQLEIMVHSESIKGGEALAIDLEKCIRCNACVESCVAVHDDGVPRLSKKGNRISAEGNALGKELSLTTSCYHCETPGCMMSCVYGAIRRDSQGLIRFIWDNCVGCAECTKGCPYDVIRLTEPPSQEDTQESSWIESVPLIGSLFAKPQRPELTAAERGYYKEQEVTGKAVKCDRCEGLPFEACVYNCPCGAIERVPPTTLFDLVQQNRGES
ncbi:MAG: cyclic nucleotide-binding domain-containing protein [Planctomycetota bacterium]